MDDIVDSPSKVSERAKNVSALIISFFAAILAIASMGGADAAKEAVFHNIQASNLYSFYQAKNIRQSDLKVAAKDIEIRLKHDPALREPGYRKASEELLDSYRKTIERYESEPDTNEGKKQLLERAKIHEELRNTAVKKDPFFDYAEALIQIAIVLVSVYIITGNLFIVMGGSITGLVGIGFACFAFFFI
jgi:hypothetical protein